MGFVSKLFVGNKEGKALREVFEQIRRILEDKQFQLDMIHPAMQSMIETCPAYAEDPNGTGPFGFLATNPISVKVRSWPKAAFPSTDTWHPLS